MRIVLDLQALQSPSNRSRGIGRAYRSLVREIILQRGDHEILVVINGLLYDYAEEIWDQLSDILPIENFHVWHGVVEMGWHQATRHGVWAYYRQINTILYQAFLAELNPDVVLLGNFCDGYDDSCLLPIPGGAYKIPFVMICYDLIPLVYPDLYDDRSGTGFIDFYRLQLAHLKIADHIFAISDSVKNDIVRLLDYPAADVTMTSLGFTKMPEATLNSSSVQDVCHKYNIKKPFILYVSTQDPRKNHVGVIQAFARLDPLVKEAYQIVFAGSNFIDQGRLSNAIRENNLPPSVLSIAIHPSDEDLQVLYKLAHLGIFPSLYEGFGLGILESMAVGLPVIASNTSAMPEVMGREDALFDPTDADDMAAKIAQGLTDAAFREDLVRFGFEHIEKWDWAKCGKRAIAAFEQIHLNDADPRRRPDGFSARQWAIEQLRALPMPGMGASDVDAILAKMATAIELTYPTPPPVQRRRVFIDASEFVHYDYNTGIQRVIKCVVIEMSRQIEDVELALVYSHADGIGYHYAHNLQDHLLNGKPRLPFEQESTERVAFADGDILLHSELTMPQVVRQRFYLQTLRRIGVKTVFLVYDLIPINYSFHAGHHGKETMLRWLSCLLQGDKLISISRATEQDIRACVVDYELPYRRAVELDWFHLGGNFHNYIHQDTARGTASQVVETFLGEQIAGLRGKINFLMVGTIEPRKSHADMLRVMELLWAKGVDVNLVVVGKIGWLDDKQMNYILHHSELGRRFFLFNDLSDVQLNEIYGLSSCLLYFSKVEGFGLPLIEGAQHGLPIIVRDAPVFREICGEHAFYFPDDLSPAEVAPYIERWLALYANGEHPTSTDMPWLTWRDSIACLIVKVFAEPNPTKRLTTGGDHPRIDAPEAATFAMTADVEAGLVVGILTEPGRAAGGAVQSSGKIGFGEGVHLDIAVRREGQTVLDYAQALQATYADSHILLLHESVFVPSSFLENVRSKIRFFADRNVAWGVIGNSGITFPYFKPVRNMLAAGTPSDWFAGVLPAAQLDANVLLIHRDVRLQAFAYASSCPPDTPIADLATLAAWEAERPCWICNLPVYVDGGSQGAQLAGDSGAWARYLATRYNNASIVSAYGTIGLSGHAADARDYYYGLVEPVLNRATRHLDTASVTVFVFATYYDPNIFDRCLMGIVSQFQRPEAVYLIGLDRLDTAKYEEFRAIVERYRHYVSIHWAEEKPPGIAAIDHFRAYLQRIPGDGFSILVYDTFVLFPQAVRQIREFLQFTLRDEHVLPITTAEISRLHRTEETRFSSRPRAFFREVEKFGFTHRERWLSSEPSSTLHFTFPNAFLRATPLDGIDLFDLGSALPQRLLAEPVSFFLIERGAGYMSFQKSSPDETLSPLAEAGTPFHLANKAGALLGARSNVLQYAIYAGGIAPALSWRDESEAAQRHAAREAEFAAREAEFAAYRAHAEHELANVRDLSDRQEASLNRFRNSWYFKARRRLNPKTLRDLVRGAR